MILKIFLTFLLVLGFVAISAQPPKPIPGQYIVVLKESVAKPVILQQQKSTSRDQKAQLNKSTRDKNLAIVRQVYKSQNISQSSVLAEYADVICGFAAKLTNEEVAKLKADKNVGMIYPDYEIQMIPPVYEEPSHEHLIDQQTSCAVSTAGGPIDGSSKPTWIWILDTGIDASHPDLNVQKNSPFAVSFISGQTWADGKGHGTHCAGIAAARNNNIGVVGVSAGAKVVPVKVLDNTGHGSWSSLISGLNHVAIYDIPNDVVSMSLGGCCVSNCETYLPALRDIIHHLGNAGTWVVMAAGNDYGDAGRNIPGCINGTKIYTVGSISCNKVASDFSNFNPSVVDWVAVGETVFSTLPGGGYGNKSGTSMATPVVAGIIHARGAAPVSGGTVNCDGNNYPIAHR